MKLVLICCALLLAACANPYVTYYHPNVNYDQSRRLGTPPEDPQVYAGSNPKEDIQNYEEAGYTLIGYSSFNGANVKYTKAIDEGREVGADVVLVYSQYTNTVSGVMPLTMPHNQVSTTNMNGSVYGNGGMATVNGTATTTTYGTETTYVPYSVNRSNYVAIYLAKTKFTFGAFMRNINDQERQAIGSNSGVYVLTVVNESPAFNADILPGDILLKLDNQTISDYQIINSELHQYSGQQVTFTVWRNGKTLKKTVKLN